MKNLTFLSYNMFLVLGIYMTVGGVAIIGISEKFGVDSSMIGYSFTGFSIGISLGVYLNKMLLDKISLKKDVLLSSLLIILAVFGIIFTNYLYLFFVFMFILGLGIGIYMSNANYILMSLYIEKRNSKINIGNFFFSIGAIISPFTAGKLMEIGVSWEYIYLGLLIFVLTTLFFQFICNFGFIKHKKEEKKSSDERLNLSTIILGLALFAYVMSEMVLNYWAVSYYIEKNVASIGAASLILTVFWIFMAFGRLLFSFLSDRMKLEYYLLITSFLSFIFFIIAYRLKNIYIIYICSAILGIGFSGIYANILSYGIRISKGLEAKAMTYIVWWSSVGGVFAIYISSFIKQSYGLEIAFASTALFISLIFIFVGLAKYFYKNRTD